jgi:hypothetical protein
MAARRFGGKMTRVERLAGSMGAFVPLDAPFILWVHQ